MRGLASLAALIIALSSPAVQADPVTMTRYALIEGRTLHEGAPVETPYAIASLGKMMTSVAVLQLVEQGKLRLSDPVASYVDEQTAQGLGGLKGVTLRHLLSMTSGLPEYFDADFDPNGASTAQEALRYAFDEAPYFEPGAAFDYSNTNYVLLGLIVAAVTGQPYAQIVQQNVLTPAGMQNAFVFGTRPLPANFPKGHEGLRHVRSYYNGPSYGDGAVIASVADIHRFFVALFEEGRLLGKRMLRQMLRDEGRGYGLGIAMGGTLVGHSGLDRGFASEALYDLDNGHVAILLAASAKADTDWVWDVLD